MTQDEIILALKSDNIQTQKNALYFLFDNKTYNEEIIKLVADLINSKDKGVKSLAIDCLINLPLELHNFGSKYVVHFIESNDIELRNIASDILNRYQDVCYEYLKDYLKHPTADVRQFALDIWGNIASSKDWEIVVEMLNDSNKNVVISAIIALGNIRCKEVVDKLIEKYNEDEEFRPFVINSLGKIGDERAKEFLFSLLGKETDSLLQFAVIDSFSLLEVDEPLIDILVDKLLKTPKHIQPYFLKTLCKVGEQYCSIREIPPQIREIALESLKEEDLEIRIAALKALRNTYNSHDIDYLIIELSRNEPETFDLIFDNLMYNSEPQLVSELLEKVAFLRDAGEIYSNIIAYFYRNWESFPEPHKLEIIKTILTLIDEVPESILSDFFELFSSNDPELFSKAINKVAQYSTFVDKNRLNFLKEQYNL